MKTIVIIPAKDEGAVIGEVVSAVAIQGFPVLVVDDGSSDQTGDKARAGGAVVLTHPINRGQGAALKTGIDYAVRHSYETAVFFDADGQMEPAEINLLINKLSQDYDVVLGSRHLGRVVNMPAFRQAVKKVALFFTRLTTGLKITDTHIGFQAWRVEALKKIRLDQDRMAHASQILAEIARQKLKYAEVPVTIKYTAYSQRKGQGLLNAFNIIWDLLIKR